jgi:hypothetical protein
MGIGEVHMDRVKNTYKEMYPHHITLINGPAVISESEVWCNSYITDQDWAYFSIYDALVTFCFKYEKDAILFALKFGTK